MGCDRLQARGWEWCPLPVTLRHRLGGPHALASASRRGHRGRGGGEAPPRALCRKLLSKSQPPPAAACLTRGRGACRGAERHAQAIIPGRETKRCDAPAGRSAYQSLLVLLASSAARSREGGWLGLKQRCRRLCSAVRNVGVGRLVARLELLSTLTAEP